MCKGKQTRRKRSSADKLRIVLKGMGPGMDVATLCRQEGLSPTQYYAWKKQLVSSGEAIYGRKQRRESDSKEVQLAAELTRMKNVIAEFTAENLELKKTL